MSKQSEIVTRRVAAVIDRLDVAMQFHVVDTAIAAQVLHAVDFAVNGPTPRRDEDWLHGIDMAEGLALVRALLPFVRSSRRTLAAEVPS